MKHKLPKISVKTEWSPEDFISWRCRLGLTQTEAAKLLGFKNRSSICHLELGNSIITPRIVMSCKSITEKSK